MASVKKKMEIKVRVTCDKCRQQALETAASEPGIEKLSIEGPERDRVVVIGQDVDLIALTKKLKKKLGCAEIKLVEDVKEPSKEEPKKPEPKKEEPPKEEPKKCPCLDHPPCPPPPYCYPPPCGMYTKVVYDDNGGVACVIM